MGGRILRPGIARVIVERAHVRHAVLRGAHRPGGAQGDLCQQPRREPWRLREARAQLAFATRGDGHVHGQDQRGKAGILRPVQHVLPDLGIARRVQLEPALAVGQRSDGFRSLRRDGRQAIGNARRVAARASIRSASGQTSPDMPSGAMPTGRGWVSPSSSVVGPARILRAGCSVRRAAGRAPRGCAAGSLRCRSPNRDIPRRSVGSCDLRWRAGRRWRESGCSYPCGMIGRMRADLQEAKRYRSDGCGLSALLEGTIPEHPFISTRDGAIFEA